jgi:hypothetical protein
LFDLSLAFSLVFAAGCESRKVGAVTAGPLVLELVEKDTGKACAGVLAEALSAGHPLATGTSRQDGFLELPHSFTGKVVIRLQDPLERYVPAEIELKTAGKHKLELLPGLMARLKVLDEAGAPCERVEITAWPLSSAAGVTVCRFTLRAGEEKFGPLPPGRIKVLVASPRSRTAVLDLSLKVPRKGKSQEDLREVRLSRGGTSLRGRVVSPPERLPKEALLRIDGVGQLTEVSVAGEFEFTGLSPLDPRNGGGKAMLVLRRGQKELYARDLELGPSDMDLGVIELGN